MNQGGWGLREFLGFLIAIFFATFIAMVLYNRSFKDLFDSSVTSDTQTYEDIEDDLASLGRIYTDNYYYKVLEDGDSDYVTVRQLQKEGLLTNVIDATDNRSHCSGYVHFYRKENSTHYDSYIKCNSKYITDGYQSKHDEDVE